MSLTALALFGLVQIEHFGAKAVGSVSVEIAVDCFGQTVTDVLLEVLFAEGVVQRGERGSDAISDTQGYVVNQCLVYSLHVGGASHKLRVVILNPSRMFLGETCRPVSKDVTTLILRVHMFGEILVELSLCMPLQCWSQSTGISDQQSC